MFGSKVSEVAQEIAQEFRLGKVIRQELDPNGISILGVKYLDEPVTVSWYSSGMLRDVSVDGKRMLGGKDADVILSAARERAGNLLEEELNRLDHKRRERAAPQTVVKTD